MSIDKQRNSGAQRSGASRKATEGGGNKEKESIGRGGKRWRKMGSEDILFIIVLWHLL